MLGGSARPLGAAGLAGRGLPGAILGRGRAAVAAARGADALVRPEAREVAKVGIGDELTALVPTKAAAGEGMLAGIDRVSFDEVKTAAHWLQSSNPMERGKWDVLFNDLPPVKFHPIPVPLEPLHAQIYAALRAEYAGKFAMSEQDQQSQQPEQDELDRDSEHGRSGVER